ncbi:polyprenyl synthetase [Nibricoccus aquaticus]|uniref:Polyprenyl synthetase n=1 Tax=Nibricoccus aquaticus TaxID=2576891 RepID=A0A290QCI5_9BACT|nr:farnesyl diphosphate synthase [Nibricoccus aquaticus]ATC64920.1 polyprenyl synthetase [Nibricoccus aquaticus]
MDFPDRLHAYTTRAETALDALLPSATTRPARIHEAMRYSLQAGGKRLRPVLALATAELTGQPCVDPLPAAVALECIHTYSLIHDDLPCMDNDDFRRGRPTCHKAFDEATALLAGDALLTHAFRLLATQYAANPTLSHALTLELSNAASSEQLIGGQMEDLLAEKKSDATPDQLEFIHLNKTAAMIRASLVMGGLCAGLDAPALDTLRVLGRELGLTFQIIDDILDATADSATLGKTAGKDAKADKTTFVKLHGLDGARRHAREHTDAALAALAQLPGDTAFLRQLVETMLVRKS